MNNRVHKFSSSGVYQNTFGGQGSGEGRFTYPRGLAVDASDNLYVADSENNIVQKVSKIGAYLTQLGSTRGSGNGQFSHPWGVAIDGSGNLYVLDTDNYRVQEFSSTGVYQTKFGSMGDGDGQFNLAYGFAVDSSGNVYVADTLNHRIQKFAAPQASGDLKITVKDKDSKPIVGVSVSSTTQPSGQQILSGSTGSDGTVTFTGVAPGSYTMQASKSGYVSASAQGTITGGSISTINIILQTQATGGGGTSSGGIPGFPVASIVIAVIICTTWFAHARRKLHFVPL